MEQYVFDNKIIIAGTITEVILQLQELSKDYLYVKDAIDSKLLLL